MNAAANFPVPNSNIRFYLPENISAYSQPSFPPKREHRDMLQASSTLLVLLNHVPLARPIAKQSLEGSFPRSSAKNRIDPFPRDWMDGLCRKFQNFLAFLLRSFNACVISFWSGKHRVKTRGKIFTGHVTLLVAHFDWPRFLFLHFLAGFSARCRATMLRERSPSPQKLLLSAYSASHLRICNRSVWCDICNDVSKIMRSMLEWKCFSMKAY